MYSYSEVKNKAKRHNSELNDQLHPFASKFSLFFSWIFINLSLSANHVTALFFIVGLIGSFLFLSTNPYLSITAFLFWRLHIIFDICDGEVARFNQKFSINGAYWDYMIHAVLYPLYFINIAVSQYYLYGDVIFLFLGIFGGLVLSLQQAVKNNYFKAMLFNGQSIKMYNEKTKVEGRSIIKHKLFLYVIEVIGFEGFIIIFVVLNFFENKEIMIVLLSLYICLFLIFVVSKFVLFSVKGYYPKRN